MVDHDRDRDSLTGQFVTDEFAVLNPATTTSEDVRDPEKDALRAIIEAWDAYPRALAVDGQLVDAITAARKLVG